MLVSQSSSGADVGFYRLFGLPEVTNKHRERQPPHALIHGDSTARETLPSDSVDLIVTSPPYNIGMEYGEGTDDSRPYDEYLEFNQRWLSNCLYWARRSGRLCVNVGLNKSKGGKHPVSADITQIAMQVGWQYHATILWLEGNISKATAWGSYASASAPHVIAPVEVVLVFYKEQWRLERPEWNERVSDITGDEFKDWVRGMWEFSGENRKPCGHIAAFPPELPARCIKLFSFVGDVVLDPFSGSGTTMLTAMQLGRVAQGIELEAKYCEASKQRLKNECRVEFAHVSSGKWEGR